MKTRLFPRSAAMLLAVPLAVAPPVPHGPFGDGSGGGARAESPWTATAIAPADLPADIKPNIVAETRRSARSVDADALPDGRIATGPRSGGILAAWYAEPTRRYTHAILGDDIEAGALRIATPAKQTLSFRLPQSEVFEDRTPRLADLDGDGTSEVVTIRASLTAGAAVTVYGLRGDRLVQLASTPFIGTRNRWLNIAAIARFRGGQGREIAYVQTPHIGGTLFFLAFENNRLTKLGEMHGFSNHEIGAREMRLSAIADPDGNGQAVLAVPSADRRALRLVRLGTNGPAVLAAVSLPASIDRAIAVAGSGAATRFTVGLADDSVFRISRVAGN